MVLYQNNIQLNRLQSRSKKSPKVIRAFLI